MLNANQNSTAAASPIFSVPAKNAQAGKPQNTNAQNIGTSSTDTKNAAAKSAPAKGGVEESQDRFLKLLVTQMKNQDPLNPMDNAQVTSQMAQLSTVSGIDKLNATLKALSGSMAASQSLQASSMIGHVVMAPGNKIELKGGKAAAALDLEQSADSVSVQIKDATGSVVRTMNLGSQASGVVKMQWDGLNDANEALPDGNYQFAATAYLGEKKSSVNGLSYGLVNGVVKKPEGSSLSVEQLGEVGMDTVKEIL
jgi:flagellar basal-body rod modification protein FlgD